MRELFPHKKVGDRLEAAHVNRLSEVARRLSAGIGGSYGAGYSGTIEGRSSLPPFTQEIVRVVQVISSHRYYVRVRYYDSDTESWSTTEDEYIMDTQEVGGSFVNDETVVAFFHQQSEFFIPLTSANSLVLRAGKANDVIAVDSTEGAVKIWENGIETDTVVEDVRHDWITNNQAIASGTEVIIGYFSIEGVWRIIGAACP